MTLLKVGISTTTIEPALTGGRVDGIGVYTRALVDGLPAAGCAVQGFSFPPLKGAAVAASYTAGTAMPGAYPLLSVRDLVTPLASRMPVDLFHATDYRIVRMRCPVVATLHDAIPLKYPEWCNPRLRRLKNWLQGKAARKADHVIALSHYAVDELVECYGVDAGRITVVPCGVSDDWHAPPPAAEVDALLAQHGLKPGYFLFVGTLQPRKNIGRIIDAYLQLPQATRSERQLVIVGRPGWQCEDLLKKMQAVMQDGESLVWLNNLADARQLRGIYAGAGVFVFPSLYEGFGIPVAEAFASGLPVVTSNTTSLPEVSQGAALEIDPLSVGELAAAMRRLSEDDGLRERCIARGLQRAQLLTWRRTVDETVAVYKGVMERM